jgi:hypothetical protein
MAGALYREFFRDILRDTVRKSTSELPHHRAIAPDFPGMSRLYPTGTRGWPGRTLIINRTRGRRIARASCARQDAFPNTCLLIESGI